MSRWSSWIWPDKDLMSVSNGIIESTLEGIDNVSMDFVLSLRISTSGISSSDISSVIGVEMSIDLVVVDDVDGRGSLALFDLRMVIFFERFGDCLETKFKKKYIYSILKRTSYSAGETSSR